MRVLPVSGGAGKDQGIKDDICRLYAVFMYQNVMRPPGNLQLPLSRHGHALFIDQPYDQSRPIATHEGDYIIDTTFPVFQVHRIDDRLALTVRQCPLNHPGLRGVDHQRRFDQPDDMRQKRLHITDFIPVRITDADIHDLRSVALLPTGHFRRFFVAPLMDQTAKPTRADDIGPLAHQNRTIIFRNLQIGDAGDKRTGDRLPPPRRIKTDLLGHQSDMLRCRAATSTHHIEPTSLSEALQRLDHLLWGLSVVPLFVRQTRIRHTGHGNCSTLAQRPQMIGHQLRPRRAVQSQIQQIRMLQAGDKGLHILAGQHRAPWLNRNGYGHGNEGAAQLLP